MLTVKKKTEFQYFTCAAMQGWELANQRNMPHIPAADVCLTTDRGVQHLLLWEPTQPVPVLSTGRRNPTPRHDWVAPRGSTRPKERLCAWKHMAGQMQEVCSVITHSHPHSCHQSRSWHREAPMFHAHACTETQRGKKIPWASDTEIALKALSSARATTVFSQLNSLPCGRVTTARLLLSFISIFTFELALATSRL